jgi:hypothetical protein
MTPRFLSPQTAAVAPDVSLLDLFSEFIDANADTVCLIRVTGGVFRPAFRRSLRIGMSAVSSWR